MSILWNRVLKTSEQTLVSLTASIMLRTHKHFARHLETNTSTYLRSKFHMTVTTRIASFCKTKLSSTVLEYTRILLSSISSSPGYFLDDGSSTFVYQNTWRYIPEDNKFSIYLLTWSQIQPFCNTSIYSFNIQLQRSENSALTILHSGRQSSVHRSSILPWDHLEGTDVTEEKWI
jgi:hypothetical protein